MAFPSLEEMPGGGVGAEEDGDQVYLGRSGNVVRQAMSRGREVWLDPSRTNLYMIL